MQKNLLKRRCFSGDLLDECSDDVPPASRKKVAKPEKIELPEGAETYEDIFAWPDDLVPRLLRLWRLRHISTEPKKIQINLTTSYSGAGFAEAAALLVAKAFQRHTLFEVEVKLHSQTEIKKDLHQFLVAEHVFSDLMARASEGVTASLETMQKDKIIQAKKIRKGDKDELRRLGDEFFREAMEYLSNVPPEAWHDTAYCVHHCGQCKWMPDRSGANNCLSLWVEIAGNTCTPWSARGSQWGWLDPNSLPSLIWVWSLKRAGGGPDLVVNECTVLWPGERFFQSVFPDALVESCKFSPTDLGSLSTLVDFCFRMAFKF